MSLSVGFLEVGEPRELRGLELVGDGGAAAARGRGGRLGRRGGPGGHRRARGLALRARGAGGRVRRGVRGALVGVPQADGGLLGERGLLVVDVVGALGLGLRRREGLLGLLHHGRGGGDHDLRHAQPAVVRGQLNFGRRRLARRRRRLRLFVLHNTPHFNTHPPNLLSTVVADTQVSAILFFGVRT